MSFGLNYTNLLTFLGHEILQKGCRRTKSENIKVLCNKIAIIGLNM